MEPIWLKSYPPGVPPTIEVHPAESLVTMLDAACARYSQLPAFTNFGRTLTYADLEALTARFAAFLQGLPDIEPGDRVALMMPNLLQYPVCLFGVWRAGMVAVSVNPMYTADELEHQLVDSGAKLIVILEHRAHVLERVLKRTAVRHVVIATVGDLLGPVRGRLMNFAVRSLKRMVRSFDLPGALGLRDALAGDARALREPGPIKGSELACLQYTGGTTGRSKGAMLTHGNLLANVRQMNTWFQDLTLPGVETVLTPLPLYHVYALTCNCLAYVDLGGHNILITDPRDTRALIAEMRRWPVSAMTGVNTLYQSLVNHPDLRRVDFSTMKLVSAGGMAVMRDTAERWAEITGTHIHEGYGLSETSPVVTSNPHTQASYNGSIGLPLPSTEVSLRDDQGREVPIGESGELCVRGPQVMRGYWNDTDGSDRVMTTDGFLLTGDIATVSAEGYFRIVDRKKDMILVSAFNVYPNEVEDAVTLHPDVVEAAVVGVPDARTGEAVKAFVVLRSGARLGVAELQAFCREHLAPYKIPTQVEFRDALPKSNVGKILRRALRDGG